MFRRVVCVVSALLIWQGAGIAADQPNVQTRIVAATVKTAAKTYVASSDIQKLRASAVGRLEKMKTSRFNDQYADAYESLKDLPTRMKMRYGIAPGMSKAEAIRRISTLDKKQIYELIDALPDDFVASEFNRYMAHEKKTGAKT